MSVALVQQRELFVTWERYEATGMRLAKKIGESEWDFDHILCIARGGMFIGDMLSRLFNKRLAVIFASSYRSEQGQQKQNLLISNKIASVADQLGRRVLLVDDLVDSGNTLSRVKNAVEREYPETEIKTAVLWKKSSSCVNPDYYAEIVDGEVWIHQPFEKFDKLPWESLQQ